MNLFAGIPAELPDELIESLASGSHIQIERIVSRGHASPPDFWYDQPRREWVLLLAGAARIRFDDSESLIEMRPGDTLDIPARQRHRVEWTTPDEPTIWLAIHFDD